MHQSVPASYVDSAGHPDGYRFLLAEDHPLVRVGLRQTLQTHFRCAQIGEAATGPAVLAAIARQVWDLLILDIGLPERSGLDILPEIKQHHPHIPVLVLTVFAEDQMGLRLLKGGVDGYLTKACNNDQLVEAVQRVLAGGKYISLQLAERIAVLLDASASKLPHETLSNREFQILRMLGQGRSVAEIAAELGLDTRTIGTFRRHILRKLHLTTTLEIIYYAIRNGLAE